MTHETYRLLAAMVEAHAASFELDGYPALAAVIRRKAAEYHRIADDLQWPALGYVRK